MAEAMCILPSSIGRIWAEAGLKPDLTKGFKVSNHPMFEEKVTGSVWRSLDPPARTVVSLCRKTGLDMALRLMVSAQPKWRKPDGHNRLPEIIIGAGYCDGPRKDQVAA